LIPKYSKQNAVDLKTRVDLNFLESTGIKFEEIFAELEKEAS